MARNRDGSRSRSTQASKTKPAAAPSQRHFLKFSRVAIPDMVQFIAFASFGTLTPNFITLGQNVLEEDLDAEPDQHQPADDFRLLAQ